MQRPLLAVIACLAVTVFTGAYWGCGEYPPGPAEAPDFQSGDATAAGPCGNKRKDDLKNIWHGNINTIFGDYRLFTYTVHTNWGYRPNRTPCANPGVIRWRHSEPEFIPRASVGSVQVTNASWHASGSCYDGGRQCLTRRDIRVRWTIEIQGVPFNGYVDGCIATRIGPGGDHNRNVFDKESCDSAVGRALARADRAPSRRLIEASVAAQRAYRSWDRAEATIDDYVDGRTAARIERRCSSRSLDSASCRQTLWRAYTSLSPAMQRRAATEMAATARGHR